MMPTLRLEVHVLEDHAVGPEQDVARAALHPGARWVVEVRQQYLVRQPQGLAQVLAHRLQRAPHPLVDAGGEPGCGLDRDHRQAPQARRVRYWATKSVPTWAT